MPRPLAPEARRLGIGSMDPVVNGWLDKPDHVSCGACRRIRNQVREALAMETAEKALKAKMDALLFSASVPPTYFTKAMLDRAVGNLTPAMQDATAPEPVKGNSFDDLALVSSLTTVVINLSAADVASSSRVKLEQALLAVSGRIARREAR